MKKFPMRVHKLRNSFFNSKNDFFESNCKLDSLSEESSKERNEWTIEVLKNNIRQELLSPIRQMKKSDSFLTSMENGDNNLEHFENADLNPAFLWASFIGKLNLMQYFEQLGADINYKSENENISALHLAALAGSMKCCQWLLQKGCSDSPTKNKLTSLHYAVLGNSKEILQYLIHNGCKISNNVINSAVYANAVDCVKLLLSMGVNVNQYYDGMTSLHVATDLKYMECIKELLNDPDIDVDLKTEFRKHTALHIAAENGYADCIELLLDKKAKIGEVDCKQQTALHLACKMKYLDCVDILLKRGAPVNVVDLDQRTPIHTAIDKSTQSLSVLEKLVHWKADVNVSDRYGYTPLHIAAINELEECVTFLILNGANVAAETETGSTALNIICRKTPGSIPAITKRLVKSLSYNQEQCLKFSFRELITNSKVGEMSYLFMLLQEGHIEILEHPLCRAFLYLKWQKIKPFYFFRVIMVLLTICLLTFIVIVDVAKDCHNIIKRGNLTEIRGSPCSQHALKHHDIPWYFHFRFVWGSVLFLTIVNIIRKVVCTVSYSSLKNYFSYPMNIVETILTLSIFLLCLRDSHGYMLGWQKIMGTFSVLLGWIYLTFTIGQLPFFGTYITMFQKVLIELLKLLAAYFCLLIGFTFTFTVLFPNDPFFKNQVTAFVRTMAMMTGELNLTDIVGDIESPYLKSAALFVLALFIVLVTIVLMNLLIGIAVSDVEGLRKTAGLTKLVQQTQLIYFLELSVFHGYIPNTMSTLLKRFLFVFPDGYRVVLYVRPMNPTEKRLPKRIMMEALQLALDKNKPRDNEENKILKRLENVEKKIHEIHDLIFNLNAKLQKYDNKVL